MISEQRSKFTDFIDASTVIERGLVIKGAARRIEQLSKEYTLSTQEIVFSVFAVLFAYQERRSVQRFQVVDSMFSLRGASVWEVDVDETKSIISLASSWVSKNEGDGIEAFEEYLSSAQYPLLCSSGDEDVFKQHLERRKGILTSVIGSDLSVLFSISQDNHSLSIADVTINQLFELINRFLEAPEASISEIMNEMPPIRLDLELVSHFRSETLDTALENMIENLGMVININHLSMAEIHRSSSQHFSDNAAVKARAVLIDFVRWNSPVQNNLSILKEDKVPNGVSPARLPNGMPIVEVNANETKVLYDEIFGSESYIGGYLHLNDGDVIFDVGANIGLFSIWASQRAKQLSIYAFEPAIEVRDALDINCRLYNLNAKVYNHAVSSKAGSQTLTYYPESTLQSGLFADLKEDTDVVKSHARQQLKSDVKDISKQNIDDVEAQIDEVIAKKMKSRKIQVETTTISEIIDKELVESIGLLKVDVEKAEHEVLKGIRREHWGRIRQLVIEVHDKDGRLSKITEKLELEGYLTHVIQDYLYEGTNMYIVYATRERNANKSLAKSDLILEYLKSAFSLHCPGPPVLLAGMSTAYDKANIEKLNHPNSTELYCPIIYGDVVGTAPNVVQFERDYWLAKDVIRAASLDVRPLVKALIIDADGTLWSGVCGEVGPENVVLDVGHVEFQHYLKREKQKGRLLFLSTKNNLNDIELTFKAQNQMPLSIDDFTAIKANWRPKSESITEISHDFGVAVKSMVFIDDNPIERVQVQTAIPDIQVVELPADAGGYVASMNRLWSLDQHLLTDEDSLRSKYYEDQFKRNELATGVLNFSEYLKKLDVVVDIHASQNHEATRIAQMFSRITQFNATLRKLSSEQVLELLSSSGYSFSISVQDKFGDYGHVGFVHAYVDNNKLNVDDFLLSCRALGRNVEWAILKKIGELANELKVKTVCLQCRYGDRNIPVQHFYKRLEGFTNTSIATKNGFKIDVPAMYLSEVKWKEIEATPSKDSTKDGQKNVLKTHNNKIINWSSIEELYGSVDHRFLRKKGGYLTNAKVEPEGEVENYLASVWSDVLNVTSLGVTDDLIALGGNSFTAAEICSRILKERSYSVRIDTFLSKPSIRELAGLIVTSNKVETSLKGKDGYTGGEYRHPSLGQKRIWASEIMSYQSNPQIIPLAFEVTGELNIGNLEASIKNVICHHSTLSTAITLGPEDELIAVDCQNSFELDFVDLSKGRNGDVNLVALQETFYSRAFNVETGPLLHAVLFKIAEQTYTLFIAVHHLCADGWSISLILDSISRSYSRENLGEQDRQFWRYSERVNSVISAGEYDLSIIRSIQKYPQSEKVQTDSITMESEGHKWISFESDLLRAVSITSRSTGIADSTIYLAAYAYCLSLAGGKQDVVIGYPVANRLNSADQLAVGYYSNISLVKISPDKSQSFQSYLNCVKNSVENALKMSEIPYGLLQEKWIGEELNFLDVPFDALFTSQSSPSSKLRLELCETRAVKVTKWPTTFKLMLDILYEGQDVTGLSRWSTAAQRSVVETINRCFDPLLRLMTTFPKLPLSSFPEKEFLPELYKPEK